MEIGSVGYNYSHGPDFEMNRPNGPGCWLMLFVKTPALFEVDGTEYTVSENSFIIFSPRTPCRYRPLGNVYTDDWIYFGADENDVERFKSLNIPINQIVKLGDIDELSRLVHILAYEHYSANEYSRDIERHYTEIMLLKLSRMLSSGSCGKSRSLTQRNFIFTQIRSRIFTMPESVQGIEEMAKEAGMSRSGFQHQYKKIFGVSVMADVISGRLDRAKRLLASTDLTIREISEKCGYSNEYNFMRQFKERDGKTPTEYRKIL